MVEVSTQQDLLDLERYKQLRDAARNGVQNGLYPNIITTLTHYLELEEALEGDLSRFAQLHSDTTSAVAPYINEIIGHAQAIAAIVEEVVAVDPNVFPNVKVSNE